MSLEMVENVFWWPAGPSHRKPLLESCQSSFLSFKMGKRPFFLFQSLLEDENYSTRSIQNYFCTQEILFFIVQYKVGKLDNL